jgi:hypothetical protein
MVRVIFSRDRGLSGERPRCSARYPAKSWAGMMYGIVESCSSIRHWKLDRLRGLFADGLLARNNQVSPPRVRFKLG